MKLKANNMIEFCKVQIESGAVRGSKWVITELVVKELGDREGKVWPGLTRNA